ncbi:hypothetical protein BX600DRAFT_497338 [Xylariales sp. PMI_506]|nr:hypothetical protein BX600DRAFT_497338 [Xylariales sp. PMI_506]
MAGSTSVWDIAYTALMAILNIVLISLMIASCFVIPQRKDPVRTGFKWLKATFALMYIGVLLLLISSILILLLTSDAIDNLGQLDNYDEAIDRMQEFGFFFQEVSQVTLFVTLIDLALGILYCWNMMHKARKIILGVTYGFAAMEGIFALAILAKYEAFFTQWFAYFRDTTDTVAYPSTASLQPFRKLIAAFDILLFIASVVALAFAIYVRVLASKRADHRKASAILIAASSFFLLQCVWDVAADAMWVIGKQIAPGTWDQIVGVILGSWTQCIAMVLLFAMGGIKAGGLWSTHQTFAPAGQYYYTYNTGPVLQQPPQPQQPYPQQPQQVYYVQPQHQPEQPKYAQP